MDHMVFFVPPRYFRQEEFVDPGIYLVYKNRGQTVWNLFKPGILFAVYSLRVRYGKAISINNWHDGGPRKWSGFRTDESPNYSPTSQHALGGALDFFVEGMSAEEVRIDILRHQWDEGIAYITALEMTKAGEPISWVHADNRNHDKGQRGILQIHA
jgi:hypothetical protein